MDAVYPRGGTWYANCKYYDAERDKFVHVRKSTRIKVAGAGSKERAMLVRADLERRLATGRDRKKGASLAQAFVRRAEALAVRKAPRSTVERSEYSAARVFEGLGPDTEIASLDTPALTTYAAQRMAAGASSDTVRRELADLSAAAKAAGVVMCPLPRLAPSKAVERWLTADECLRLLSETPPKRARVIMLVLQTGLRKGEVWHLQRIAPGLGRLVGEEGLKTGARTIPLTPVAEEILLAGPLEPWTNQGRDLKAYARRAGLGRVTWNDLRATPATLLMLAGLDRAKVAALLGHKSTRMVDRRYARIASIQVQAADLSALTVLTVSEDSNRCAGSDASPTAETSMLADGGRGDEPGHTLRNAEVRGSIPLSSTKVQRK